MNIEIYTILGVGVALASLGVGLSIFLYNNLKGDINNLRVDIREINRNIEKINDNILKIVGKDISEIKERVGKLEASNEKNKENTKDISELKVRMTKIETSREREISSEASLAT